ncbi:hypothetical protein [Streptomyces sp. cg40]|uniref:hypothetical protein n=1 Tax=Streptomyces sp. cg40 TaxID=3419764 RepID=UPI003D08AADB
MEVDALPRVDEHATVVAAGVDEVWRALTETLDRTCSRPGAARYARLVGCVDRAVAGPRPLAEGSAFPGFRVVGAVPGEELVLRGSHRFSVYAFVFRLDELAPGRTRLRAETRAVFPGPAGAVYRLLVIGSGGHAAGVRRLLAGIRRRAE